MSVGNLKTQGNQGNNTPFQLRSLQLLGEISTNTAFGGGSGTTYGYRTATYQAIANGVGYSIGDILIRYDVIDVATSTVVATIWFNQTTQATIAAPLPADITPVSPPSSVTVINGVGGAAVNIQDGGNSITVDATNLDIRDLVFATDKVDVSGSSVTVSDGGGSITVDGTVAATQSGTWNINNISGTISLPTGAATQATLLNLYNNSVSKMDRVKGAANYSRTFSYYGSTNNVSTIVHTGTTPLGVETITETFNYVNNLVDGSNVTSIVYS